MAWVERHAGSRKCPAPIAFPPLEVAPPVCVNCLGEDGRGNIYFQLYPNHSQWRPPRPPLEVPNYVILTLKRGGGVGELKRCSLPSKFAHMICHHKPLLRMRSPALTCRLPAPPPTAPCTAPFSSPLLLLTSFNCINLHLISEAPLILPPLQPNLAQRFGGLWPV